MGKTLGGKNIMGYALAKLDHRVVLNPLNGAVTEGSAIRIEVWAEQE